MINYETILVVIITSMGAALVGLVPGYWKMRADRENLELSKQTFATAVTQRAQAAAQHLIDQQMAQIEAYIKRLEQLEADLDEERSKRMDLAGLLEIEQRKRMELSELLERERRKNMELENALSKAQLEIQANVKLIEELSRKVRMLEKDTGELKAQERGC